MKKTGIFSLLLSLTIVSFAQIRFIKVDPTTDHIWIKNFGGSTVDISGYKLCTKIQYTGGTLSSLTLESGSLNLAAGDTVELSGWGIDIDASGADLALYVVGGSFGTPADMRDFLQWKSAGNGRESEAQTAGKWKAGTFLSSDGPYIYNGGAADTGVSSWMGSVTPSLKDTAIRIIIIHPDNNEVVIKNMAVDTIDVSHFQLGADVLGIDSLKNMTVVGNLIMTEGDSIVVNPITLLSDSGDCSLFLPKATTYTDPDELIDYVQWNKGSNSGEATASAKGIWGLGDFIYGNQPYYFTGTKTDFGVSFFDSTAIVAPTPIDSTIRIVKVDLANQQVSIKNFGNINLNISTRILCSKTTFYPGLSTLTVDSGSITSLEAGATVIISGITLDTVAADLGLYLNTNFTSASAMIDFVQWGSAGNGRESVANTKDIWTTGDFLPTGESPYMYTGNGQENGKRFWTSTPVTVEPGVADTLIRIVKVDLGTQQVTLRNFGDSAMNISDYQLCSKKSLYPGLSSLIVESGSITALASSETVVLSGIDLDENGADLGLYVNTFDYDSIVYMKDFVQWGSAGNGRESVADRKGIWTTGDFLTGGTVFEFTGTGLQYGKSFWSVSGGLSVLSIQNAALTIYPNPASDYVQVDGRFKGSELMVFDITGKTVIQTVVPADKAILNISNLRKGTYILQITKERTYSTKLMIE